MGRTRFLCRAALSALVAVSMTACGGGDGGGNTGTAPTPSPTSTTPPTSSQCSLASRQAWALQQLEQYYLFPELLDRSVDPSRFTDLQSYVDALVAPARAQGRDRYFTYVTSIAEERRLIEQGTNAGFGFRLSYNTSQGRLFVSEAFETAPAFRAGIDRGAEITAIDGQSVSALFASGGAAAVSNALGPSDPGVTRTLTFVDTSGVTRTARITKAEYALDPVSDRYGVRILNDGQNQVGYINLRTFIVAGAEADLRAAFDQFRQLGITEIILDFRYNGGGLVSTAELIGDLLGRNYGGQVFSRTTYRPSLAGENSTRNFMPQPQSIAVTKLAIIGTEATASASELVANAFIPYLGNNVALIGDDTYGKPVGQIAIDRSACDDRFRIVAFRTVNAAGQGDYYNGLASVFPRTCRASDDITKPLGDAAEASIAAALDFLGDRACTPISTGGQRTLRLSDQPELLTPRHGTTAERDIPGSF